MDAGTTRDKIINLGRRFSQRVGYHAFSYKQIATELNIKNASIHHYFPSKDDLALAIIARDQEEFLYLTGRIVNEPALKQVESFLSTYGGYFENEERLCVIGTFSTAFNDVSPRIRTAVTAYSNVVIKWLNGVFSKGLQAGEFSFPETSEEMTALWMAALPGSLAMGRTQGPAYFHKILDSLKNRLVRV